MSSVSRAKKKKRVATQARAADAISLLAGDGESLEDVFRKAMNAVNLRRHRAPEHGSVDEEPWLPSARDGSGRRLRSSWEHLRDVLPDINRRHAWRRRDRWMHVFLVRCEQLARKLRASGLSLSLYDFLDEYEVSRHELEALLQRLVSES